MILSSHKSTRAKSALAVTLVCISLAACKPSGSQTPAYALPKPLTLLEKSDSIVASNCAAGGTRMVHGLDHDADGYLAPYERLGVEYLCNDLPVAQNSTAANVAQRAFSEGATMKTP